MADKNGFYDIDLGDEELELQFLQNSTLDDMFYLKNLQQRKLYLTAEISQMSVESVVTNILQYNCEDRGIPVEERKPIMLYLTSVGGDVDAGFELIDAIQMSKTPVYTINLGYWYSMAFLIGIAGHCRYAMPNAKFLIHDGSNFILNSGAKAQDQMKFNKEVDKRVRNFIVSHTCIKPKEYTKNQRVEWYMFADQAKKKGCIDKLIGLDCDIEEVV